MRISSNTASGLAVWCIRITLCLYSLCIVKNLMNKLDEDNDRFPVTTSAKTDKIQPVDCLKAAFNCLYDRLKPKLYHYITKWVWGKLLCKAAGTHPLYFPPLVFVVLPTPHWAGVRTYTDSTAAPRFCSSLAALQPFTAVAISLMTLGWKSTESARRIN